MAHRYTQNIKLPYPKVGTSNPTVKLFVVDLNDKAQLSKEVIPPKPFLDSHGDDYIYWRAYWITDAKLGVIWMNRVQVRLFQKIAEFYFEDLPGQGGSLMQPF